MTRVPPHLYCHVAIFPFSFSSVRIPLRDNSACDVVQVKLFGGDEVGVERDNVGILERMFGEFSTKGE